MHLRAGLQKPATHGSANILFFVGGALEPELRPSWAEALLMGQLSALGHLLPAVLLQSRSHQAKLLFLVCPVPTLGPTEMD